MATNKTILFTIIASLIVFELTQTNAFDNEFDIQKYSGKWFSIGRISACNERRVHLCSTYKIMPREHRKDNFVFAHIPHENISSCDHGVPIHIHATIGKVLDSAIHVGGVDDYPHSTFTIKSYNGGDELILTEIESDECASKSYRLWSRKREASARTKSVFEKLARGKTITYYPWQRCPLLRSETNDEFTINKFNGTWYDISSIRYGASSKDLCKMHTISMEDGGESFVQEMTTIRNGNSHKTKLHGRINDSKIRMKLPSKMDEHLMFSAVSCNNGEQLILAEDFVRNYGLLSRKPNVPAETIKEFGKITKKHPKILHEIHHHDTCNLWKK